MNEAAPAAVVLKSPVFTYGGQRSHSYRFREITFNRGEKTFIHGPSGSGKSTLLGLIAGVLLPQKGSVSLLGQNLSVLSSARRDVFRGEHLGIIFQAFNLIPHLSARDNILLPSQLNTRRAQRCTQGAEHEVCQLAEALGLSTEVLHARAAELSIGQQQRVAAARALLGSPAVICADEPTSALDALHRESFLKLLFEQCEKRQSTLLFVSHDLALASCFDRVVAFNELLEPADTVSLPS